MGGSAYLITVKISDEAMARLSKQGLFGRLLSRLSPGPDHEFSVKGLKVMEAFKAYISERLPEPWSATTHIDAYLSFASTLYLRKGVKQMQGTEDWYIQMMFGGCAGMAEVSASVCTHWAGIWFRERRAEIERDILTPFGLSVTENDWPEEEFLFIPLPRGGYAQKEELEEEEREEGWPLFLADAGSREDDGSITEMLRRHENKLMELAAGRCRCQFCDPGFRLTGID